MRDSAYLDGSLRRDWRSSRIRSGLPASDHMPVEGPSEEHWAVLKGYLRADFDAVLNLIFPL